MCVCAVNTMSVDELASLDSLTRRCHNRTSSVSLYCGAIVESIHCHITRNVKTSCVITNFLSLMLNSQVYSDVTFCYSLRSAVVHET